MRLVVILTIIAVLTVGAGLGGAAPSEHGLSISPEKLPDGVVGQPYKVSIKATGGGTAAQIVTCGDFGFDKLPKGVGQTQVGPKELSVKGTPTATGSFIMDVCAQDELHGFRRVYEFKVTGKDAETKPVISLGIKAPTGLLEPEEIARFTVLVKNHGGRADRVRVRITAEGIDAIGAVRARCVEKSPTTYECDFGAMAKGANGQVDVTVRAGKAGSEIAVNARILEPTGMPSSANTAYAHVQTKADLWVTKEGEPPPKPGTAIVWTIVVGNKGPDFARVDVDDKAPAGIVFKSVKASPNARCNVSASLLDCVIAKLDDGEKATITLRGQPRNAELRVTNTAVVKAAGTARDPLTVNNRDSATTRTR